MGNAGKFLNFGGVWYEEGVQHLLKNGWDTEDTTMEVVLIVCNFAALWSIFTMINSVSRKSDVLTSEVRSVESSITSKIDQLNERMDDLGRDVRELERLLTGISSQCDRLDDEISTLNESISEVSNQVESLERDVSAIDTDLLSDISLHLDVIESLIVK